MDCSKIPALVCTRFLIFLLCQYRLSTDGVPKASRPLVDNSGDFNGSGSMAAVSMTAVAAVNSDGVAAVLVATIATVNSDKLATVRVAAVHFAAVMAVGASDGYYVTSRTYLM
jgi:hypothetical protein